MGEGKQAATRNTGLRGRTGFKTRAREGLLRNTHSRQPGGWMMEHKFAKIEVVAVVCTDLWRSCKSAGRSGYVLAARDKGSTNELSAAKRTYLSNQQLM